MDTRNDKSLEQSREEEKIEFSKEIWSKVPRSRVGIVALKQQLERLLCEHITQELPKMQMDVFKSLKIAQSALADLGPARPTVASQREHLISIAELHTEHMKRQLEHVHQTTTAYNFWNRITKLRERFQSNMKGAATYNLGPSSDDLPSNIDLQLVQFRAKEDGSKSFDKTKAFEWLAYRHECCRGRELPGRIDSKLVDALFKELTVNWKTFTDKHLNSIKKEVESCFYICLKLAAYDNQMFNVLKKHLRLEQDEAMYKMKKMVSRHVEKDRCNVSTTNPEYEKRCSRARAERISSFVTQGQGKQSYLPDLETLARTVAEPRWTIIELHDMLRTYYELAAQHVVDSISKQIIDPFITGDGSPLKFFNRKYVEEMTDENVEKIAAETPDVVLERKELEEKIQRLTEALHLSAEEFPLGTEMKDHLDKTSREGDERLGEEDEYD